MGVRLYLPPGATLTAKRTADGFDFSASEPLMLDGGGGPVADVALKRLRWIAGVKMQVHDPCAHRRA